MAAEQDKDLGKAFVDSLLECGLVRRADIDECVETSKLKSSKDKTVSVIDVLVHKGYLTPYQFKKLMKRLEKLALVCHHCKAKIAIAKDDYDGSVECGGCKETVSLEKGTASFGEALVIDHPRRLADKLLGRLLIDQGLLDKPKLKKYMTRASESFPKRPLDGWLVDQGKIEPETIRPIRKKRDALLEKRYPYLAEMQEDVELGRFLVKLGLVSLNRLNECLLQQAEKAGEGQYASVRDLLRDSGELTEYQIDVFLPRQFDRLSRRTEVLKRPAPVEDAESSQAMLESQVELIEEMKSDPGLLTIQLEEPDEEHLAALEKKKKRDTYDNTALDPGNMLRAYIEKTYGKRESKR